MNDKYLNVSNMLFSLIATSSSLKKNSVESRIAWKWANSSTPDKNVGQTLLQWATMNRVRSEQRRSICWPILF